MLEIHGNMRNILAVDFGADKTWSSVASTSNEQTATIPGLKSTDKIMGVTKPTLQAGLGIGNARVSAADTIAITFITSGATVTPTAGEVYTAFIARLEHTSTDASA
jgi:hypothetical protein